MLISKHTVIQDLSLLLTGVSSVPRFYNGKALLSISQLSKRNLTLNVLKTSHFQENSGTETLFPHPFLGRAVNHFDAPTESPHLLSKEMFKIVRISQNEDIIARGKVRICSDHKCILL